MKRTTQRLRGQSGFTLAEVLVASAVFVVIMVAALTMYDRSNRVFKSSVDAAELQQNVRVAYDRMIADVRMAGFDYMRAGFVTAQQQNAPWIANQAYTAGTIVIPTTQNGHTYRATVTGASGGSEPTWPTGNGATVTGDGSMTWEENGGQIYQQPDEQIEYAGTSAITIRANFDYSMNETSDPATHAADGDHGRETGLESAQFPIVTTGNDEIVTYALVSNTASANTGSVQFYADVNNGGSASRTAYPGGNAERQITVSGVDLTNNNPPYTLYRFTLDSAGAVVRTPLANNIRSLTFLYYTDPAGTAKPVDSAGAAIENIGGDGQYNPATASTASAWQRVTRGTIRAVRVRLVGMNGSVDTNYQDTDTANGVLDTTGSLSTDTATQNYRKMVLDTTVVPRNLGVKGMTNTFLQPPIAPTITSVCIGYCGIAVVNWTPNTTEPNASYLVEWDTNQNGTFANAVNAGVANSWAVDLTQQDLTQTYYFKVVAYNQGGSRESDNATPPSAVITNATQPNPPTSVTATGNSNTVTVTWSAPTGNATGAPSCTGGATAANSSFIREIQGYEIQRDTSSSFSSPTTVNAYTNTASGAPVGDGYGNYTWTDTNIQQCMTYYYRVKAYEWCYASTSDNTGGNRNTSVSGYSSAASATLPSLTPQAPTGFQLDSTNSSCNAATNACSISMNWQKVTQSTANQPIGITQYQIRREQYEGATSTLVSTGSATVTGTTTTISYTDTTATEHDTGNGLKYQYKYYVQAIQPNGCPSSAYAGPVIYPTPCTFSGSVVVETGATGAGTQANPWVMSDNDTLAVHPPSGTTLSVTEMDVSYNNTVLFTRTSQDPSSPTFTWSATGLTQGQYYTAVFTITNTQGCTQQLIAYLQEEVTAGCTLTAGSGILNDNLTPQSGTAASGNPNNQTIKMTLTNSGLVAVTITSIDITWTAGNSWTFKDVYFPGAHTYSLGNTTNSPLTLTVNPLPGGFTSTDVTVPQSGSAAFYLDFGRQSGNTGGNIGASSVFPNGASICIHYTRSDIPNFTFACRVYPSAATNNPHSCN